MDRTDFDAELSLSSDIYFGGKFFSKKDFFNCIWLLFYMFIICCELQNQFLLVQLFLTLKRFISEKDIV